MFGFGVGVVVLWSMLVADGLRRMADGGRRIGGVVWPLCPCACELSSSV